MFFNKLQWFDTRSSRLGALLERLAFYRNDIKLITCGKCHYLQNVINSDGGLHLTHNILLSPFCLREVETI